MPTRKAAHPATKHSHGDEPVDYGAVQSAGTATHVRVQFDASALPGPCAVRGLQVGDVLLVLLASDGTAGNHGFFETVVTVDDELQQRRALVGHSFDAIFLRGV